MSFQLELVESQNTDPKVLIPRESGIGNKGIQLQCYPESQ